MNLQTTFSGDLELRYGDDGRLLLHKDGRWISVKLRACFPWTNPREFVSLRDDENVEHALVRTPRDLPEAAREPLQRAMAAAGFAFQITALEAVEKDFELRVWKVRTEQGQRRFVTAIDDWPRELEDGKILLEDLSGDLYVIADREALDPRSRRLLWAFVD
jgi:hypothetical protein